MSFGGHVQDMVNRMNQNRSQRTNNKTGFKGNNRDSIYSNINPDELNFKKLPQDELNKLKKEIQSKQQLESKKQLINNIILFVFASIILTLTFKIWIS